MNRSIDYEEIQQFSKDSAHWWDEERGPFAVLHRLNPVRLGYIRERVCVAFDRDTIDIPVKNRPQKPPSPQPSPHGGEGALKPLEGLRVLDVGCGGGLVCEPLARMGACVSGLDADAQAIDVARAHAVEAGLEIDYRCGAVEEDAGVYDVVTALEIIEHVTDPAAFVASVAARVKPGGLAVFSTLNRNAKSFALGIVAAEHILRWVPRGTHDWRKFVRPSELARYGRTVGLEAQDLRGLVFNPIRGEFALSERDLDVNYLLTFQKQ